MTAITAKVAYVKSQGQTRLHTCHWPGCDKQVPPALWGCKPHWYALPKEIREAIWNAYQPGQERSGRPSFTYIEAAKAAQAWIRKKLAAEDAARAARESQGALPL